MSDLLLVIGVCVLSSFLASFGLARWLRKQKPESAVSSVRMELDVELDELDADELRRVLRFTRELRRRSDEREVATDAQLAKASND